uniref:Uncharacterized protein n=1 Tax=Bursaphelenchus xylophilus TaxID=6326 RepID=A0A1I7S2V6_BURXY
MLQLPPQHIHQPFLSFQLRMDVSVLQSSVRTQSRGAFVRRRRLTGRNGGVRRQRGVAIDLPRLRLRVVLAENWVQNIYNI